MGGAAHDDHLQHGVGELSGLSLRHVGDRTGDLGPAQAGEAAAVQPDLAGLRRDQAEQRAKQGGLARAVGSEEAQDLARADRQVDAAADGVAGIAEAEPDRLQAHQAQPVRPRASSQRKNGAPTRAVRMPKGVSTVPRLRAAVSTSSR